MLRRLLFRFIHPSTRAFWQEARHRRGGSFQEAIHGVFYLKWPEFYISVGLGRNRLARLIREPAWRLGKVLGLWNDGAGSRFADTYHGKAMPLQEAVKLIRINRSVNLELTEKVLPYNHARAIILDFPDDLALLRCPCRATVESPCQPMDVCIIVGKPVVDFVLEHHPEKARRIGPDEAVAVVEASQKRGHVSHAFFKEAVLGRYYAICNCCSCCCGAMQAHRQGTPMLASSGYVAEIDAALCVSCGKCASRCPFSAISGPASYRRPRGESTQTRGDTADLLPSPASHDKAATVKSPIIDRDACLGCGICVLSCPVQAIRLVRDPSKPEPLEADELASDTRSAGSVNRPVAYGRNGNREEA